MTRYYNRSKLIDGIRARDEDVFEFIIRRYKPSIVYHIREKGGNLADANDIFQDGLVRMIEMVDKEDFILSAELSTLLYSICNNLWKLHLEKKRVSKNYFIKKVDDNDDRDINEEMDLKLYESIFWTSFKMLKKDCQTILKALMKGIPTREVAFTLDYSYDYLRRKKIICHTSLQKLIAQNPDYKTIKNREGSVKLY